MAAAKIDATEPSSTCFHSVETEEALKALSTTPDGLQSAEASRRLAEHGPNVLPRGNANAYLFRIAVA